MGVMEERTEERVSVFLKCLLRKKSKGPGSEGPSSPRRYQEQISELSNPNIALKGVQRAQNLVACSFEPVKK